MIPSAVPGDEPRPGIVLRLRANDPGLTAFGLACLMTGAIVLLLPLVDGRLLDGVPVWIKPAKFFASVGVFALTFAWFSGYVRPGRREARPLRTGRCLLMGAGGFELGYINLQAALGEASHFNRADPLHAILYGLMGLGALTLLAAKIPLAWEIARRPVAGLEPGLHLAVVLGLAMTIALGAATGITISAHGGHAVGAVGAGLPLLGWNRAGGDLRVAHFLGLHGEQILPLAAGGLIAVRARGRRRLVALAGLLLCGLAIAAWIQARSGIAVPFG